MLREIAAVAAAAAAVRWRCQCQVLVADCRDGQTPASPPTQAGSSRPSDARKVALLLLLLLLKLRAVRALKHLSAILAAVRASEREPPPLLLLLPCISACFLTAASLSPISPTRRDGLGAIETRPSAAADAVRLNAAYVTCRCGSGAARRRHCCVSRDGK